MELQIANVNLQQSNENLKTTHTNFQTTNNNFKISIMNLEDLKQISPILTTEFDDFWNSNILEQELCYENSKYIIAKNNDQILGFAGIRIAFDQADLMNIVINKNYRNQKIGTALLQELIKICKEKNVKDLILEVNENNTYAISMYENFNFKKISTRKNYYKNETALIMKKEI